MLGGTVAELADYIQVNGGVVIGAVALASKSDFGLQTAGADQVRELEQRFGSEIASRFGIEPSPPTRPDTSFASEMLTTSELESLMRKAAEDSAYYRKAFADLRPRIS